MVVGRILDFKRKHKFHYWLRMIVAAWLVVQCMTVAQVSADVDVGAETDSIGLVETSQHLGTNQYSGAGCRQMNGTLWQFKTYENPADGTDVSFYGYFSEDEGTTWGTVEILNEDDPIFGVGDYPELIWGAVALSNNSIILGTYLYGVAVAHREISFLCHWNNSNISQWERVLGYSHGTQAPHDAGMNVNDTDVIGFAFDNNVAYIYTYTFDPATRTVSSVASKTPVNNMMPQIRPFWEPNNSRWVVTYQYEPGSGDRLYWRSWDLTTEIHNYWVGSTNGISDIVMLANETYVWIEISDTAGWPFLGWWDSTTDDEEETKISGTSQWATDSLRIGISNLYPTSKIKVYGYQYLDDDFHQWDWLNFWATEATFQSNHAKWWEETSDWTYNKNFVDWAPYQLYPRIWDPINTTYVYTQLQNNGTYCTFTEYDADNDPDFWVTFPYPDPSTKGYNCFPDIPFWMYDPYYVPPAPGPTETASNWTWWGDAACLSSVSIIACVLLVGFIIIQATTRR